MLKGLKKGIFETSFTNLFPDLLNGIHLWRSRRQEKQTNIIRNDEFFRLMPNGVVQRQKYIVFGVRRRQFSQKYVHAVSITIRRDEKKLLPVDRVNRSVNISVLSNMVTTDNRSYAKWRPTNGRITNPAKSRFIFKHDAYLRVRFGKGQYILSHLFEFGIKFFLRLPFPRRLLCPDVPSAGLSCASRVYAKGNRQ